MRKYLLIVLFCIQALFAMGQLNTDRVLAIGRNAGNLEFLTPFLSLATRDAIAKEPAAMRAGLALASPDFMYK